MGESKITMLGTGNAMCTRCYNTCFMLRTPGGGLLVDGGGGNGIFRQLHRADIGFDQISNIFVTHVHTDHLLGIIWLIRKLSPMIFRGKREGTVTIYCHNEVKSAIEQLCAIMMPHKICSALGETIILREVVNGETVTIDDMTITFFDVESDKTKQFGFRALMPDGKRVVCLGDEPYNERNETHVRDCDWLLCEAFCLYRDREQFRPYEKHHSTALDAGRIAAELGVKNLLLYHTEDTRLTMRRPAYTAEAAQHFKGNIVVPDDIETVTL